MDTLKKWGQPLLRTFLAAFATTLLANLVGVTHIDLSLLQQVGVAALVAGVNAVVLVLQRAIPGIPNPANPSVTP